jgi:hypothetical protein
MNIKQSIFTCTIFVMASFNCYGMPSSVEQIISDEEINKLLPRRIGDVPDDQKTIAREFEALQHHQDIKILESQSFEQRSKIFNDFLREAFQERGIKLTERRKRILNSVLKSEGDCESLPLPRSKAPLLHAMVERISKKMQINKPLIFIGGGFSNNAGMCSITFGCPIIVIGGPALEELDDQALEALLAHECGHIKGKHFYWRALLASMPLIMGPLLSGIGCSLLGLDWKLTVPLFALGTVGMATLLLKFFLHKGVFGYFQRLQEKLADGASVGAVGPQAVIKLNLVDPLSCDAHDEEDEECDVDTTITIKDKSVELGNNIRSKQLSISFDDLKKAIREGFAQKEDPDTLWKSIKTAHNDSHPNAYQRIVAAARVWAKKLTAAPAQAG